MIYLKLSKAETSRIGVFNTVMKTKSLSQAALALDISQSSVYAAIKKLRILYNDALFIRDKKMLVPTEFAKRLHVETLGLLKDQQDAESVSDVIDKLSFTFSCAAHIATTVIPLTYLLMQQSTPFTLEHTNLPSSPEDKVNLLLNNKVDVIFDYMPIQHKDIFFKRLFKENYAIVCRKDHPRLYESISLKQFSREKQAALRGSSGFDNLVEEVNIETVSFCSHNYLDLLAMVEVSDLICVIPVNIYLKLQASFNIKELVFNFRLNIKKNNLYINYLKDPARQNDKEWLLKKMEKMH